MDKNKVNNYMLSGLALILGILFFVFPSVLPFSRVIWLLLVVVGVIIIINNVNPLVDGIKNSSTDTGKMEIILSSINMVLGLFLILWQNFVVVIIIALGLIVTPLIEVFKSSDKMEKLKEVAVKILTGVLLIIFGPLLLRCADTVGKVICYVMGGICVVLAVLILLKALKENKKEPKKDYKGTSDDGAVDAEFTEKK